MRLISRKDGTAAGSYSTPCANTWDMVDSNGTVIASFVQIQDSRFPKGNNLCWIGNGQRFQYLHQVRTYATTYTPHHQGPNTETE